MARTLRLPRADGTLTAYRLTGATPVAPPAGPIRSRIAYAAVHVVADPLAAINPTLEAALDWDATLAYRRYIWSLGLAVAEAMDTSQRGMGFDWSTAKELIRRAVAEARGIPGAVIASGAGTDHLEPGQRSEEHTSELQSPCNLVCRLLLEKKKKKSTPAGLNHQPD